MSIRRAQDERIEGTPDGFNAVTEISDVPDAPTIGTATASAGAASVTFTAAATGGTATSYTATSTPGSITGSAASSPVTVTGLTAGTAYTFKVKGVNATATGPESAASNSATPTAPLPNFIALGRLFGYANSSTDGITWTDLTIPTTPSWSRWVDGVYSSSVGKYVAVAYDYPSTSEAAMYSTDGLTWTHTTMPNASPYYGVAFGNGVYAAVGYGSTWTTTMATSTDGITWTGRTKPTDRRSYAVVYGDKFVVANRSAGPTTSTDGVTWVDRSGAQNEDWFDVGYSPTTTQKYVMVGANTTNTQYSTDGISWSAGAMPNSGFWNCVTYGDKWFATTAGPTTQAASSTDGITWTTRTMPASKSWRKVVYLNNLYVAIAYSSSSIAASSTDGITWTQRAMTGSRDWYALIPKGTKN